MENIFYRYYDRVAIHNWDDIVVIIIATAAADAPLHTRAQSYKYSDYEYLCVCVFILSLFCIHLANGLPAAMLASISKRANKRKKIYGFEYAHCAHIYICVCVFCITLSLWYSIKLVQWTHTCVWNWVYRCIQIVNYIYNHTHTRVATHTHTHAYRYTFRLLTYILFQF